MNIDPICINAKLTGLRYIADNEISKESFFDKQNRCNGYFITTFLFIWTALSILVTIAVWRQEAFNEQINGLFKKYQILKFLVFILYIPVLSTILVNILLRYIVASFAFPY